MYALTQHISAKGAAIELSFQHSKQLYKYMIENKRTAVQRANQNGLFSYCTSIKLIAYKCNSIDEDSLCHVISHVFIDTPVILLLLKCQ